MTNVRKIRHKQYRVAGFLMVCLLLIGVNLISPINTQAKKAKDSSKHKNFHQEAFQKETREISSFVKKYWKKLDKQSGDLSKFETCRIVVKSENLVDDFGAADSLHVEEYSEFILQYPSAKDTKNAYKKLRKIYGKDCYVDQIMTKEVLMEAEEVPSSHTPTVSQRTWGYETMGFDNMAADWEVDDTATVAIIDTGCDMNNWYFDNSRFHPLSYDFVDEDTDPRDETQNGHGTHVAGIISTCSPKQLSLMILRVFDATGNSSAILVDTAIQYAVNNNASAINMSMGYEKSSEIQEIDFWDASIDQAYAANIPICCAAGNGEQRGKGIICYYPACLDKTVSVGSIDNNKNIAPTSSQGEKLDFCAPGVGIVSALNGATWDEDTQTGPTKMNSGTSMACPHVTTAFAYLKKNYPNETVRQLYQRAVGLCVDLGTAGKDATFGNGYIYFSCTHDYDIQMVEPTHFADGYTIYTCRLCGNIRKKNITPKTPHHFLRCVVKANQKNGVWQDGQIYEECEECHVRRNETVISAPKQVLLGVAAANQTSKPEYNYTGKEIKPAIIVIDRNGKVIPTSNYSVRYANNKKVGKATVNVTFSGNYVGSMTTSFKILPLAPKKITVKSLKAKTLTVKWKKAGPTTKYQLQYSLDKNFRKGVKKWNSKNASVYSKTIKNLKRKKVYYVRMRSVYRVGKVNYWSKWSKIYKTRIK